MNRDERLFRGVIVDQRLQKSRAGDWQLLLTVKLKQRVLHGGAGPTVDVPNWEVPVFITFGSRQDVRNRAFAQLRRLGFEDNDIGRLRPTRTDAHLLYGIQVHVKPNKSSGRTFFNLCWPQWQPDTAVRARGTRGRVRPIDDD